MSDTTHTEPGAAPAPTPSKAARAPKRPGPAAKPVKYRCRQTGSTWSGRGKQPRWVTAALEQGRTLAELATADLFEGAAP